MDLLSRVLAGIRVKSPLLARIKASNPASMDMPGGVGLPFYYAMNGAIEIEVEGVRHLLNQGELALLPRSPCHLVHLCGGGPPQTIVKMVEERRLPMWLSHDDLEVPLHFEIGPAPFDASVLSGNFLTDAEETTFLLQYLPGFIKLSSTGTSLQGTMEAVWQLVLDELNTTSAGFSAVASRALELIVLQTLRLWLLQADQPPSWALGIRHDNVRRALQAMYEQPGRGWTLSELAQISGQSRSAFAVTFAQTMGETPFAHLRRLRIHLSASQVHTSRKSLATIAAEFGYANRFVFSRAFKSEIGITPAAYRKQMRSLRVADPDPQSSA